MIREYIDEWFLSGERAPDKDILTEAGQRYVTTFARQMTERTVEAGKYYPSAATKCERQNGLRYAGMKPEPLGFDVNFKFGMGDDGETRWLAYSKLALKGTPHSIGLNNEHIPVMLGKAHPEERNGYIDGLLSFDWDYHWEKFKRGNRPRWLPKGEKEDLLVEIKTMGSWAFNFFKKSTTGPDDTWGYLGQIMVYMRSLGLKRFLYVAIDKEKGDTLEWVGNYDPRIADLADQKHDRVMEAAAKGDVPPIPQNQEKVGIKKNGELDLVCSYCGYKGVCMPLAGYELKTSYVNARTGKKPIFHAVPDGEKTPSEAVQETIEGLAGPSTYSR